MSDARHGHTFVSSTSIKSSFKHFKTNIKKTEVIMKTLRIALIATLVALVAGSMSAAGMSDIKPKQVVDITFEKAITYPDLVLEMYMQLDEDILTTGQLIIVGEVVYHNMLVRISGTYAQWEKFFRKEWLYKYDHKTVDPKQN